MTSSGSAPDKSEPRDCMSDISPPRNSGALLDLECQPGATHDAHLLALGKVLTRPRCPGFAIEQNMPPILRPIHDFARAPDHVFRSCPNGTVARPHGEAQYAHEECSAE